MWESLHAFSMSASAGLPLQLSTSHKRTHTHTHTQHVWAAAPFLREKSGKTKLEKDKVLKLALIIREHILPARFGLIRFNFSKLM